MPRQAEQPQREATGEPGLDELLVRVARGDHRAFERLYDQLAPVVYGLACKVLRDLAQAEEVTQEVMIEVWRTAARYDPARGGARAWVSTMAHRRAVDRVRQVQAAAMHEEMAARREPLTVPDIVIESVEARLEHERVRRCLRTLTRLQYESLVLAYYGGYAYHEVAEMLGAPPSTVRTRMRDGLVRLRDCMGIER